nr:alpha/beta fold hydrolase [Sphingomonas daechungensis]
MTEIRRVGLSTGVTLNVAFAGPEDAPAVILLHGFPESHRTWREVAPRLEDTFRLIMPDQRGFAGSDRPMDASDYATDKLVDDIFALAETVGWRALRSSVTTGVGQSPGPRLCATTRG